MFQVMIQVQAEIWRNQVYVYQLFPWRLLQILHSSTTQEKRIEIIQEFKSAKACCVDMGFTATLRNWIDDQPAETLCDPSNPFVQTLILLALSKATNIEVECNFSRAAAARQYTRGSAHWCSTMSSKHVLSELHHQHNMQHCPAVKTGSTKRNHALRGSVFAKYSRNVVSNLKNIDNDKENEAQLANTNNVRKPKRRTDAPSKTNGWILFRDSRLANRPARLGETKQQRVSRVISEAAEDFKKPEFLAEKQYYSTLAKQKNKEMKIENATAVAEAGPRDAPMLDLLISDRQRSGEQHHDHVSCKTWTQKHGPWGVSDKEWPIAVERVQKVLSDRKGFVKEYSGKWRANKSLPVKASPELEHAVETSKGVRDDVSFCMKLGGCFWQSSELQQGNILRNLELFRNIVRYLKRGANNRDSAAHVAPLLILAPAKSSGANPEVFLLCKPHFRSYGCETSFLSNFEF